MDRPFISQAKAAAGEWTEFLREHQKLAWFTGILIFLCWGVSAFRMDVGVDSEIMLTFPEALLSSWYGLGRFGLVWTKRLLGMSRYSQTVSMTAMMAALWLLCMLVCFSVYQWSGKDRRYDCFYAMFSALFVTSPSLTEQVYFAFQVFEIVLGMCLAMAAVHMVSRRIYGGESRLWLLPALVCGVWAAGIYQINAMIFVAMSAFSFLLVYQNGRNDSGRRFFWFRRALGFVGFFVVMVAVYAVVAALVQRATGTSTAYIESMVVWRQAGLRNGIRGILADIRRFYLGGEVFYTALGVPVLLLWTALFWYRGWKAKAGERPLYVAAGAVFAVSPLMMTIIMGTYQGSRIQLVYPFFLACICGALTTLGPGKAGKSAADADAEAAEEVAAGATEENAGGAVRIRGKILPRRWMAVPALCLCAGLAWHQWIVTERLLDTIHVTSEQDIEQSRSIYRDAQRCAAENGGDIRDMAFVVVGTKEMSSNLSTLKGDIIGNSIFSWDVLGKSGVSYRVGTLLYMQGMMHRDPTAKQYDTAWELAKEMPCWPAEGSVAVRGDLVVVKLSEPSL